MEIYFAKVLEWLEILKKESSLECEWIGVYFKSDYLDNIEANELVAAPFIGTDLGHLAVEKQREHLQRLGALVAISLKDEKGSIIGELLIASHDNDKNFHFSAAIENFPLIKNFLPFRARGLESPRLILKNLEESDAADVFEFASNPNVAHYMAWGAHQTIDDSLRMIKKAQENYDKGWPIPLGIVLKEGSDRKVVGIVGLTVVSARHRNFELVYALGEKYWGKGILVEASKLLIDFSFKHFAMNRLQCSCKEENTQSARVMEKLGMKYEGVLRSFLYLKGEHWNIKMYSQLKNER